MDLRWVCSIGVELGIRQPERVTFLNFHSLADRLERQRNAEQVGLSVAIPLACSEY